MKTTLYIFLSLAFASVLFADSVGVNFAGERNDNNYQQSMAPTNSAGVVAQTNWNNPPGTNQQSTPVSLIDDAGGATSMQLTWSANGDWRSDANNPSNPLQVGYLDETGGAGIGTINVVNIPYAKYDVYVYFGSDGNNRSGYFQVNNDTGTRIYGRTNTNPFNGFVRATATNEASAVLSTYAHFTDLTDPALLIQWSRLSANTGMHGFQIVRTSLPTNPVVTTVSASDVAAFSATLNGELVFDGNDNTTVTFYYGTTDGSTNRLAWNHSISLGNQNGTFSTNIIGLTSATPTFFRAYATNSVAESWATNSLNFTTATPSLPRPDPESCIHHFFRIRTAQRVGDRRWK